MAVGHAASEDGFESQLATNHLGLWLFTHLIMDKILKSYAPRVVNFASEGHRFHPFRFSDYNFDNGKAYNKWLAYGQSKTATMLSSMSLAKKLGNRGLVAVSLHPGVIVTNLASHLNTQGDFSLFVWDAVVADQLMGNPEGWYGEAKYAAVYMTMDQGAATHVYAAFDQALQEHNGSYLLEGRLADPVDDMYRARGRDCIDAERLWKLNEKLVGEKFFG